MPRLIANMAQCLGCKTIIRSEHTHDFKSCTCGRVCVDGGRDYTRRVFSSASDYKDLSVYDDAPFEVIREHLARGGRGKDGKQPLAWYMLKDISNDYLDNLIAYQEETGYTASIDYQFQVKEQEYRKINNIFIKD